MSEPSYAWETPEFKLSDTWKVTQFGASQSKAPILVPLMAFDTIPLMWEFFTKAPRGSEIGSSHYNVFVDGCEPMRENYPEGGVFCVWKDVSAATDLNPFFDGCLAAVVSDELADREKTSIDNDAPPPVGEKVRKVIDRHIVGLRLIGGRKQRAASTANAILPCAEFWYSKPEGISAADELTLLQNLAEKIHGALPSLKKDDTNEVTFYRHSDAQKKSAPLARYPPRKTIGSPNAASAAAAIATLRT